ncbi:diguanylate cyclase domain-containing protein [Rhizobium sp. A22-96]
MKSKLMMFFSKKPTIRSSLISLVMACIIPAGLAEAGLAYHSFRVEQQQLLDDTLATARALTGALDRQMLAAQGALVALATSPALTSGDHRTFYDQAKEVQDQQQADNVVLSEPSGQQIINTLVPYGTALPMSRSPRFDKLLEADRPIITDLFIGAVSKEPHFSIQMPVRRSGRVVYTLTIGIFPKRIAEILPRQNTYPGQVSGILDSSGVIVARSKGQDQYVGKTVPSEILDQVSHRDEGYFPTIMADGTPAILLFSRSPATHWITYLTIPQPFFTQKLWDSLKWVILIPLLFAVIALIYVWIVGGAIAKSITDLITPALALGYGQKIELRPLYLREADEVGKALVEASSILRAARHEAQHDRLTGLANRTLLDERLQQQLVWCKQKQLSMAVLYIDLDGFKAVNDSHGHEVGDRLLCSVASRLGTIVASSDLAARMGGDEFVILLTESNAAEAREVADKIIHLVSAPYHFEDLTISISASVGIAKFPDDGPTAQALLGAADEAMYADKRNGRLAAA